MTTVKNQMDWDRLQILCEQTGYKFDALLKGDDKFVLILVDSTENVLEFRANSAEEAVELAADRLAIVSGLITE